MGLESLRTLLCSEDVAQVRQGLELARQLPAAQLDALLEGVTFRSSRSRDKAPYSRLEFAAPWPRWSRPCQRHALLRIIGPARSPRAGQLRQEITDLRLEGSELALTGDDLLPFQNIAQLAIDSANPARLAALSRLPLLRALWLTRLSDYDLQPLAGLTQLRRLYLRGSCQHHEALNSLELGRLELANTGLRSFAGLASLQPVALLVTGAELDTLDGLGDQPRLEVLTLERCPADLSGLRSAPALKLLTLARRGPLDLSSLPPLPSLLTLDARGSTTRIGMGTRFPRLLYLKLRNAIELDELAGLPQLNRLHLHTQLPDVDALAPLKLTRLTLDGPLEHLDRLPQLTLKPGLDFTVDLPKARGWELRLPRLRSVRGLAQVASLQRLSLKRCPALETLDGIQHHNELIFLDLRDCTSLRDVSALAGLSSLRLVTAHGTGLKKSDFPRDIRWTVSTAKSPDLSKLIHREPPARKAAAKKAAAKKAAAKKAAAQKTATQKATATKAGSNAEAEPDRPSRDPALLAAELRPLLAAPQDDAPLETLIATRRAAGTDAAVAHAAALEAERRAAALPWASSWQLDASSEARQLRRTHDLQRWGYPALPAGVSPTAHEHRRGLLRLLEAPWPQLSAHGAALWTGLPGLQGVRIRGLTPQQLPELCRWEVLPWLDALHLRNADCGRREADLAKVPAVQRLRELCCSGSILSSGFLRTLFKPRTTDRLRRLELSYCSVGAGHLKHIAAAHLPALEELSLHNNGLLASAGKLLGAMENLPALKALRIPSNRLGAGGLKALAQAPFLGQLEWLDIGGNNPGAGLAVLLTGDLGRLQALGLSWSRLKTKQFAALAAAPLPALRRLDLSHAGLDERAAGHLIRSTTLQNELHLRLDDSTWGGLSDPIQTSLRGRFPRLFVG